MFYWIARNAAKTRFHLGTEPLDSAWPGWEIRIGEMTEAEYAEFNVYPIDPIRLEVIHQEAWAKGTPLSLALTGEAPSTD